MSPVDARIRRANKDRPIVAIGVTRFSVDPRSIFDSDATADVETARALVYDPARLSQKLELFERFVIPSLLPAAEQHRDFYHLIAFSRLLPVTVRQALAALASRNRRWLRLLEVPPRARLVDAVRGAAHALAAGRPSVNFRLDDDDAIRPDFVEVMRSRFRGAPDGAVISFDLGYYLQRVSEQGYALEAMDYPRIAIGLGVYRRRGLGGCIFDLPLHHRIRGPHIIHVREEPMWIRTIHYRNDSGKRVESNAGAMSAEQVCAALQARFGFLPLTDALAALPVTNEASPAAARILYKVQ